MQRQHGNVFAIVHQKTARPGEANRACQIHR
jgi:hypothetical protein